MQQIEIIFKNYHNILKSFIRSRVPNRFIAEDILQEVFIKILKNYGKLKNQEKLRNWLFQITRNCIVDYYRKEKIFIESEKDSADLNAFQNDDAYDRLELSVLVMIQQLPLKYRQVLYFADYKGLTHNEISKKLNISPSCSKSRTQRARKMMKAIYLKCCHFEFDRIGKVMDYHNR